MRGIADEYDFVFVKPRCATDREQRSSRIRFKIFEKVRHQRNGVWKLVLKESANVIIRFRRRETAGPFKFPKKRAGERAVRIRERDHHETLPRPDMERVLLHLPGIARPRGDRQFLVAVREITLIVFKIRDLELHRLPDCRERTIDTDDRVAPRGRNAGRRLEM